MGTRKSVASSKAAKSSRPAKSAAPKKDNGSRIAKKAGAVAKGSPKKNVKVGKAKGVAPAKKIAPPSPVAAQKGAAKKGAASAPVVAAPAKAVAPKGAAKPAKAAGKGLGSLGLAGKAVDVEAVCREVACEGLSTSGGYCRLHYIKNWKKIKRKELILREKKLNQYIEELVAKYPDKYIEAIRQDLANDKDFAKVIYDLDLDESVDDFEVEGENVDSIIDNIKREFEDEGESF